MLNPLEIKHRIVGAPMKEIIRRMGPSERWTDEGVMVALYVGAWTAAFNLYPAAALIEAGVRGDKLYSHTTFLRNNPWPAPIFHYKQAASRAEVIGSKVGSWVGGTIGRKGMPFHFIYDAGKPAAKIGAKIGTRVGGRLIPGVGWALLAYDVYDVAFNQSLWGFDFA